jgi:hypothetical protein
VPGLLTIHDRPEYAYALGQYVTLAHTYHFTLETLRATMRRAGFRLLRGTEDVRAVFVTAAPDEPSADESVAPAILASLRRLDAPSARVRRVPQLAKQRAAAIAKTILPKDIQRRVKHRR